MTSYPATARQIATIVSTFENLRDNFREDANVVAVVTRYQGTIAAARTEQFVSKSDASACISALFAVKDQARKASQSQPGYVRVNNHPGTCATCKQHVPAGAGRIEKNAAGKWLAFHLDGQCPAPVAAPAAAPAEALAEGLYYVGADLYRVQASKTGNLYACIGFVPQVQGKITWEYVKGAISLVRANGVRLTAEQAAALGHTTHHCCFCSRELTDDGDGRSIDVGYGPVCARKHGLPWGEAA